jgi:hypothetical protein
MPVLSLRYSEITGQPSDAALDGETRMLRRYEAIREIMMENNQGNSLLWITRLSVPDGTIDAGETTTKDPSQQSSWLTQAAGLLHAQLFIGMTIFADLNAPESTQTVFHGVNLAAGSHPFARALRDIIQQNDSNLLSIPPGRAKNEGFSKPRS